MASDRDEADRLMALVAGPDWRSIALAFKAERDEARAALETANEYADRLGAQLGRESDKRAIAQHSLRGVRAELADANDNHHEANERAAKAWDAVAKARAALSRRDATGGDSGAGHEGADRGVAAQR